MREGKAEIWQGVERNNGAIPVLRGYNNHIPSLIEHYFITLWLNVMNPVRYNDFASPKWR